MSTLRILVDADACPVKKEVFRVALRHEVSVTMVANGRLRTHDDTLAKRVVVNNGCDAADVWIAERAGARSVVVTSDIPLADRYLAAGATVLAPTDKPFTTSSIGAALATRAIMVDLRAGGKVMGGPARADPRRRPGGHAMTPDELTSWRQKARAATDISAWTAEATRTAAISATSTASHERAAAILAAITTEVERDGRPHGPRAARPADAERGAANQHPGRAGRGCRPSRSDRAGDETVGAAQRPRHRAPPHARTGESGPADELQIRGERVGSGEGVVPIRTLLHSPPMVKLRKSRPVRAKPVWSYILRQAQDETVWEKGVANMNAAHPFTRSGASPAPYPPARPGVPS